MGTMVMREEVFSLHFGLKGMPGSRGLAVESPLTWHLHVIPV